LRKPRPVSTFSSTRSGVLFFRRRRFRWLCCRVRRRKLVQAKEGKHSVAPNSGSGGAAQYATGRRDSILRELSAIFFFIPIISGGEEAAVKASVSLREQEGSFPRFASPVNKGQSAVCDDPDCGAQRRRIVILWPVSFPDQRPPRAARAAMLVRTGRAHKH